MKTKVVRASAGSALKRKKECSGIEIVRWANEGVFGSKL